MKNIELSDEFWAYANENGDDWDDSWMSHYDTWCAAKIHSEKQKQQQDDTNGSKIK